MGAFLAKDVHVVVKLAVRKNLLSVSGNAYSVVLSTIVIRTPQLISKSPEGIRRLKTDGEDRVRLLLK